LARPRTTTPTKPNDARAHRSIEALSDALLELLEHTSFDEITIKEITKTAGVSYPTFFRRFSSKEDLLANIATEEVRRLLSLSQRVFDDSDSPESIRTMLAYIEDHRQLWRTLLTGGAAAAMREEFMRISREIAAVRPRSNPWLPLELSIPFTASGIFEIFAWWMNQPDDYPTENVEKMFNALIVETLARPRAIKSV